MADDDHRDDARLVEGSRARPLAFAVHGPALAMMGLVARLAANDQLEALRALDYATYISPRPLGTSSSPRVEMIIEADDEAWAGIAPHVEVMQEHLQAISGVPWTVRRMQPLSVRNKFGEQVPLSREGVAGALVSAGYTEEAALALKATSFQVRPRPGGGSHIVTVFDPSLLANDELGLLDQAIFRSFRHQTSWVLTTGFEQLARRLVPVPPDHRRRRVAAITSVSSAMTADIESHLNVFDLTTATVRVSLPDAGTTLATQLIQWATYPAQFDAVLIARGGGTEEQLNLLVTDEVRAAITLLRQRSVYVVAAFGHGDFHADVGADVHAKNPASGAAIIHRKFHEAPTQQRGVYAAFVSRAEGLSFDGSDDAAELARKLFQEMNAIDQQTNDLIDRNRQNDPPDF